MSAYDTAILGTTGLVSYWTMDESSGIATPFTAADAVGTNPGTYHNNGTSLTGVTLGTSGASGTAATFNGSSGYISVPHSASLAITGSFTLEAWVKTTMSSGFEEVFAKYPASPFAGYGMSISGGKAGGWCGDTSGGWVAGNIMVADGVWHHIVVTRSGSTVSVYVDGVFDASGTRTPSLSNTTALYIGTDPSGVGTSNFSGTIDAVAVYNTALSAATISSHYAAGTPVFTIPSLAGLQHAAYFSGSNYLTTNNFTGNPAAFSVAHWVNPAATQLSRTFFANFLAGGTNKGWVTGISDSTNNKIKFYLGSNTLSQSGTLANNTWTFVLCTYDGTTANIYLNGSTTADATLTSSVVYGAVPTNNYLGTLDGTNQKFNGSMTGVGYWTRALTGAEGATLYNSGAGTSHINLSGSLLTNLVSYWEFGSLALGLDATGNHNMVNSGLAIQSYAIASGGTGGRTTNNSLDASFNFGSSTNPLAGATSGFWSIWLRTSLWTANRLEFFRRSDGTTGWSMGSPPTSTTDSTTFYDYAAGANFTTLAGSVFSQDWVHLGVYYNTTGNVIRTYRNGTLVTAATNANVPLQTPTAGTTLQVNLNNSFYAVADPSLYKNPTQAQADTLAANLAAGRLPSLQTPSPAFWSRFGSGSTDTDSVLSMTASMASNTMAVTGPTLDPVSSFPSSWPASILCFL